MKRGTATMKRAPMKRGTTRLAPVSKKRKAERPAFDAVYAEVDERSGGYCEVQANVYDCDLPSNYRIEICCYRASEHHHTMKPRRSHHVASKVIHLCRACHERVDWPYRDGKLLITPRGDGSFLCEVWFAPDKFTARERGPRMTRAAIEAEGVRRNGA